MTTALLPKQILDDLPEFLQMVQDGVGVKSAAIACKWSLRQLKDLESMPQFQEALAVAREQKLEALEKKSYEMALQGNVPMMQMWLYCQGADRGWRPPAQRVHHQHQGTIGVEKVQATKAALLQIMQEHGVEALAIGGPLDGTIVDAEVVDDAATE